MYNPYKKSATETCLDFKIMIKHAKVLTKYI